MNWENKQVSSMVEQVMDPDFSLDLPSTRELLRSYIRYAYTLGRLDGYTEGVLVMSPKRAEKAA